MANTLDFNRYRPPILPIVFPDRRNTSIHLTPPTVDLQEELRTQQSQLRALLSREDAEMVDTLYDLAARLMCCNRNLMKVTAKDLRTTFNMDVDDLVVFYQAYTDFLQEIENAKN